MSPTFALLFAIVTPAQSAETDAGPAAVKLVRGQELVYRGIVREESSADGSVSRRAYDLEGLAFVLDATPKGYEVAFQTTLRSAGAAAKPGSVRLELVAVAPGGQFDLGSAAPPPDGPPTLEAAGFVALTPGPHAVEYVRGTRCVKLVRAELVAGGMRSETAWVAAQTGVVRKLERTFERRTGGARATSVATTTAYELASELVVPDALTAGRRREIRQAWDAQQKLAGLLPYAGKVGPLPFERVLLALAGHLESQPATPYRPAVLWLRERAEAGKRGETPVPGSP